jgi:hypothetical protein
MARVAVRAKLYQRREAHFYYANRACVGAAVRRAVQPIGQQAGRQGNEEIDHQRRQAQGTDEHAGQQRRGVGLRLETSKDYS